MATIVVGVLGALLGFGGAIVGSILPDSSGQTMPMVGVAVFLGIGLIGAGLVVSSVATKRRASIEVRDGQLIQKGAWKTKTTALNDVESIGARGEMHGGVLAGQAIGGIAGRVVAQSIVNRGPSAAERARKKPQLIRLQLRSGEKVNVGIMLYDARSSSAVLDRLAQLGKPLKMV